MKKKFFLPALAVLLALAFAPVVHAQTTDEDTVIEPTVIETEDTTISKNDENVIEDLEGVEVPVVEEVPSAFGLFWLGLKERVSIAFTFNPVKKAEKQVAYAEQRIRIAEKIAENSDDPDVQVRVENMIDRADELLAKVEERKEKFLEKADERVNALLQNIATHTENREAVLDRIETRLQDKFDDLDREEFDAFREDMLSNAQGILRALENPNMKEEVKQKLEEVRTRIEAKAEETKQFREDQRELLEAIKDGDEEAKAELEALREERKTELEQNREATKARLENRMETEKQLREDAMEGDADAAAKLKMMNAVDTQVKQKVEERVENRQEIREENEASLRPNVEKARPLPAPVKERVENRQEVRDDILNDPEKLNALMEQKIRESQEALKNSNGEKVEVEIEDDSNYSGDELNEDGTYKLEEPEDIWAN